MSEVLQMVRSVSLCVLNYFPLKYGIALTLTDQGDVLSQPKSIKAPESISGKHYAPGILRDGFFLFEDNGLERNVISILCLCHNAVWDDDTLILCCAKERPRARPDGPPPTMATSTLAGDIELSNIWKGAGGIGRCSPRWTDRE